MKAFIKELKSEFTTKEFVLYSIIGITCLILAACGESVILSLF